MAHRRLTFLAFAAVLALLVGCVPTGQPTPPDPSASASKPRPFTVGTTDRITVTDPAAITDQASATVAYNVFQRLMTTDPGMQEPELDAAKDCRFRQRMVFTCILRDDLKFHNGHELTSSDVKFSIERALRLDVSGSSVSALASLRRIETPDEQTIRFVLSQPDAVFPLGLASPAASIVDEEVYDPDAVRPPGESMVGSGPFRVSFFSDEQLQLARNPTYQGRAAAGVDGLVVRVYDNSAELETAMQEHQVDVVWRGLSTAAVTRFQNQIAASDQARTESGFAQILVPGARVRSLWWNPNSEHRTRDGLRQAVAASLQEYRIMSSLIPAGIPGGVDSFPVGPGAEVDVTWKERIQLTLAYDPTVPDAADQASQIRFRLEDTGGLSVQLVKATPVQGADADLLLVDDKSWSSTAMAWLQPYLDQPVQTEEADEAAEEARTSSDPAARQEAVETLQKLAAQDLVVLPINQTDEPVFVAEGFSVAPDRLGPGWQLALWGFGRG